MKNQERQSSDIQIRLLQTPDEIEAFMRLHAEVFRPDEDTDLVITRRRRALVDDPDFQRHRLFGAFSGDTYVGGYALFEYTLCLGPARLRTGCIGDVVTRSDYRHQGIATALMLDAIRVAKSLSYSLLFLHGVASFYHQFGYIDNLEDMPLHIMDRKDLPEPASGPYTVRTATREDAPALLACYQRHYCAYLGTFAPLRTLQRQEHLLCNWFDDAHPLVVLNAEQDLHGYLLLARSGGKLRPYEVAADTWPATLALLHAHAQCLDAEPASPQELSWPLPPTDPTYYFLAEHLPMRSQIHSVPNGGSMARPAHLPTLLQSLLPLWQAYWQDRSHQIHWTGTLQFVIDDHVGFLDVTSSLHLVDAPSSPPVPVILNSKIFTQLIFGFRPVSWALLQSGQQLPTAIIALLNILFPPGQAYVAGSDFF